jgi:uncharacterized membrane protein SpoIIM required for sporulation
MKNLFFISTLIWFLGFGYAFITYDHLSNNIKLGDSQKYAEYHGLNDSVLNNTLIILRTNIIGVAILFLGGFIFAAPTISLLLFNGYQIATTMISSLSMGYQKTALLFLPHSIEFVAIWIAGALGLKVALIIISLLFKEKHPEKKEVKKLLNYFLIVCAMITIGSVIEGFVSVNFVP